MSTKAEMIERFSEADAFVPGKRVRIDFGDAEHGVIMLDGAARTVTETDGEADTTVEIIWDDWLAIAAKTLDPMIAFMTGRLRVSGDMTTAMQLGTSLSRIAD